MKVEKEIPSKSSELESKYWELVSEGKLCVQHCHDCGQNTHPPRLVCPNCHSDDWEFQDTSGEGTVYGYTEIYRPSHPKYEEELPITSAVIELSEGPRIMAVVDCDLDDIEVGTPVKLDRSNLSKENVRLQFKISE